MAELVSPRTRRHNRRFVIQQHTAGRMHYDLRLEIGGVLVSWSVPEGPSLDPRVKRLAFRGQDHPIEYGDFEGVIPDGSGAGTVLLWDAGTFDNLADEDLEESLVRGRLAIRLWGAKLEGAFTLTRLRSERDSWMLVKLGDEAADPFYDPIRDDGRSIKSGRTLGEIALAESRR